MAPFSQQETGEGEEQSSPSFSFTAVRTSVSMQTMQPMQSQQNECMQMNEYSLQHSFLLTVDEVLEAPYLQILFCLILAPGTDSI